MNRVGGFFLGVLLSLFFVAQPSSFARAPNSCDLLFFRSGVDLSNVARRLESLPRQNVLPLKQNSQFKIATWNTLDLKFKDVSSEEENQRKRRGPFFKTYDQLKAMKKTLSDINADIYLFQEVWGIDNLKKFIRDAMNDEYDAYLVTGNDERGIQIGFAVKKGLQVDVAIESNKDLKWVDSTGREKPVFSRDLPVLYLRQRDGTNARPQDSPDLIVLSAHFKSKRTVDSYDFESNNWRTVHADRAAGIVAQLEQKYPNTPIILGGDFNTDVNTSPAMNSLQLTMRESLALMGDKLSRDQKVTHTYHPFHGRMVPAQLDALFVNENMAQRLVSAYVYRYKDENGKDKVYRGRYNSKIYPLMLKHRKENPSDHMPVVGIYDMTK